MFSYFADWEAPGRWAGAATRPVVKAAMATGESLALLPGGFHEAVICARGAERVYVKRRRGFVKYCLQHGYRICPVYTFGESDCYRTFGALLRPRLWLADRNIPAAAMFGNPLCPVLPIAETALHTFVGRPLELPAIAEPTAEDVALWHGRYVAALQALFDEHKAEAGKPDAVLEIW